MTPFARVAAVLLAAFFCVPLSTAPAGELGLVDGLWVMKKVDERYEGDDMQEDLHLTLKHTGEKARSAADYLDVRWLRRDVAAEERLLVYFVAPRWVAGVTLLQHVKPYVDDERWLYFPVENLIRRVLSQDEHSNFMGTDFTYYDLAEREPDEENHTLLRVEEFQGAPCYVVETTPKAGTRGGYSKKTYWVDKDRFLKLRIDYYNQAGKLKKRYTPEDWVQIDGIWTPRKLTMEDFLERHLTVIERSNIRYNQKVLADLFDPANLNGVRYRDGKFALLPSEQRPTKSLVNQQWIKQRAGEANRPAGR